MQPGFSIDLSDKKNLAANMAKLSPRMQMMCLMAMAPEPGDKPVTIVAPSGLATVTVPAKKGRHKKK